MSKENKEINVEDEAAFRSIVRKMIKENADQGVEDLGDAMDQSLNTKDGVNTKTHPNTLIGAPKNTNKPSQNPVDTEKENDKDAADTPDPEQLKEGKGDVTDEGDVTDVKMNQKDSEGGHDAKIATAVEVEAGGGTHSGDSTKGMSKSKFKSKKGMNDSKNESGGTDKGTEAMDTKMNTMDKEVDEGTKTSVEAGSEDSTGQKDAKWSEKSKSEKGDTPIATAIQLPEGFGSKPMTATDLMSFINEQADKRAKLL